MWLIIGIALGVGVLGLVVWMRDKGISFTWYEWLLGLAGIALLVFTIENVVGSLAEIETTAARMFLVFPGLLAVLLIGIVYGLVVRRQKSA